MMLSRAKIDACKSIDYVCSDIWWEYLKVIHKKLPQVLKIPDRYHLVANLNKALDEMGTEETRERKAE